MITGYHRPETLEAALALLDREGVSTRPIGGGTSLDKAEQGAIEVVDLQDLGLNTIERHGNQWLVGATTTLEDLVGCVELPQALRQAAYDEANHNLRKVATIGGAVITCDGRSTLATVLMALDAHLVWQPGEREIEMGNWLPLRHQQAPGKLLVRLIFPAQASLAYEKVSRTPDDRPVVMAAMTRWPSGRTRLSLGGFGSAPVLAMDGPEANEVEDAARFAYSHAEDAWASAEYRREVAATLAKRFLEKT